MWNMCTLLLLPFDIPIVFVCTYTVHVCDNKVLTYMICLRSRHGYHYTPDILSTAVICTDGVCRFLGQAITLPWLHVVYYITTWSPENCQFKLNSEEHLFYED